MTACWPSSMLRRSGPRSAVQPLCGAQRAIMVPPPARIWQSSLSSPGAGKAVVRLQIEGRAACARCEAHSTRASAAPVLSRVASWPRSKAALGRAGAAGARRLQRRSGGSAVLRKAQPSLHARCAVPLCRAPLPACARPTCAAACCPSEELVVLALRRGCTSCPKPGASGFQAWPTLLPQRPQPRLWSARSPSSSPTRADGPGWRR